MEWINYVRKCCPDIGADIAVNELHMHAVLVEGAGEEGAKVGNTLIIIDMRESMPKRP